MEETNPERTAKAMYTPITETIGVAAMNWSPSMTRTICFDAIVIPPARANVMVASPVRLTVTIRRNSGRSCCARLKEEASTQLMERMKANSGWQMVLNPWRYKPRVVVP